MSVTQSDSYGAAVAAEVRAWMGRRGLRGVDLAALVGRDEMWVSRKIQNRTRMTVDDLALIARALDVSVADLLPRVPDDRGPVSAGISGPARRSDLVIPASSP